MTQDYVGEYIIVQGQFRSYNRHEEPEKQAGAVSFRKGNILESDEDMDGVKTNSIFLDGYICKSPVYRKTPLGRGIADLLLAVNRPYGKSDTFHVSAGDETRDLPLHLKSARMYIFSDGYRAGIYKEIIRHRRRGKRTAYEVSVSKLECRKNKKKSCKCSWN